VTRTSLLLLVAALWAHAAGGTAASAPEVRGQRLLDLPAPARELAFLDAHRLVSVSDQDALLLSLGPDRADVVARHALPGPLEPVRAPAALLQVSETEGAFWVLGAGSPRAMLLAREGDALVARQEADALPLPGAPRGLRFRTGTSLIEAEIQGLEVGLFLEVARVGPAVLAVTSEGDLLDAAAPAEAQRLRVGPTLCALGPGLVAASQATPPNAPDAILVLAREAGALRLLARWPAPGAVRALAARGDDAGTTLAAAVESSGAWRLLLLDLVTPSS
jgi:hypothetical protein